MINIGAGAFIGTAFYNNTANWENSVLYMGNYLIKVQTNVSDDYTIRQGTKCIADQALKGCSNLVSITVPGSVAIIGEKAFMDCTALVTAKYSGTYSQ